MIITSSTGIFDDNTNGDNDNRNNDDGLVLLHLLHWLFLVCRAVCFASKFLCARNGLRSTGGAGFERGLARLLDEKNYTRITNCLFRVLK